MKDFPDGGCEQGAGQENADRLQQGCQHVSEQVRPNIQGIVYSVHQVAGR